MSSRRARLTAVPFVLLAIALRLAGKLLVEPVIRRAVPGAAAVPLLLAEFAATLLLPAGAYLLLNRHDRRRPATWSLDAAGGRFVALPWARRLASYSIFLGWTCTGAVPTDHVPGGRVRLAYDGPADGVLIGLGSLGVLFALWVLVAARPRLTLDPAGVTVRNVVSRYRIDWDEVQPGEPADPHVPNMLIYLNGRRRARRLPSSTLDIGPQYLAASIRHYAAEPATRAGIGTAAGLAALTEALPG